MGQLISLLIVLIIFCIIAYGMYWVCVKFALPQPVMWICGAILLIMILIFLGNQLNLGTGDFHLLK